MRRYLDGERPSSIFTSVGLSPAIVGRKRVERNIARWKADSDIMAAAKSEGSSGSLSSETRERLVSVQLGQIWSLTCQVFELKDRIDALERQLKEIQV
nr:transposase [Bifidobacterium catenulatum]